MTQTNPIYCVRLNDTVKNKIDALMSFTEQPKLNVNINGGNAQADNIFFGRTILELFPIKCDLPCGCCQNYRNLREFPNESTKCIHGNYFVLYGNSNK